METLHITTAADLISLIGHSLGYWPHESLVCISLQTNRMGATLRLDLPRYIYWVPDRRGHGRWTRYDFPALSLMIRGVLSPGSEALVDRL
jgi:hypothetical protein